MPRIYYNYLAIGSFLALFALLMLMPTVLLPSSNYPVVIILISTVTPLLIPFWGMLHGNNKSHIWLSYLSLFYFTYGAADAYISIGTMQFYYDLLMVFFSLSLCLACSFFVYSK